MCYNILNIIFTTLKNLNFYFKNTKKIIHYPIQRKTLWRVFYKNTSFKNKKAFASKSDKSNYYWKPKCSRNSKSI